MKMVVVDATRLIPVADRQVTLETFMHGPNKRTFRVATVLDFCKPMAEQGNVQSDVTLCMTKAELVNRRAEAAAMFLMGDAGSIYETYMRADKADAARRNRWDSQHFYFQQAGRARRPEVFTPVPSPVFPFVIGRQLPR